jgi:excisionase family DNA binding protein
MSVKDKKIFTSQEPLTTKEAAQYLGVSTRTLENWRYRGAPEPGLPYFKMGSSCRYDLADLHAFREARKVTSTSA